MTTSLPTYGVTYADIDAAFAGHSYEGDAEWEDRLDDLLQRAAGAVAAMLRKQGVAPASVTETAEEALYQLCRAYVVAAVVRWVAQSTTHANPPLAEAKRLELGELREQLSGDITGLMTEHDPAEQRGSFRALKRKSSGSAGRVIVWRKGMKL